MAELNDFLMSLAAQFGEQPGFRAALADTMISVMQDAGQADESGAIWRSSLDWLLELERQQAECARKPRTVNALNTLAARIRQDAEQAALTLHHRLKSNMLVDDAAALRIGIDARDFPVGLAAETTLLETSKHYIEQTQELMFLKTHASSQLQEIRENISRKKSANAYRLHEVALEALSDRHLAKTGYQQVYDICMAHLQRQRATAENELVSLLSTPESSMAANVKRLESWLRNHGMLARQIIKQLRLTGKYRHLLLHILIRTGDAVALRAMLEMELTTQAERDVFNLLMTLRFGEEFLEARKEWKNWLGERIGSVLRRTDAIAFWQQHLTFLPGLLLDKWPSLGFQGEYQQLADACEKQMTTLSVDEFLASQKGVLTTAQLQAIQETLQVAPAPQVDETPHEAETPEPEIVFSPKDIVAETMVGSALDAAMSGNLAGAAITNVIEQGLGLADDSLSVELADEAETPPPQPTKTPTQKISLKPVSLRKPREPRAPAKPEQNIWQDVIFPFISKNLVFVLAPTLIFIGLLLLVFTLWDKAVWIRYGLTPFLIVSVSYALARIGVWLKGEDIPTETPIAILQGVAIFLAPMSLLFVALLSVDQELSSSEKLIWGIALSAALLGAWWRIFMLAVSAVSQAMARLHTATLLLLNALLLLLPVAHLTRLQRGGSLQFTTKATLVIGFYAGFLVLMWSMRRVLGRMMKTIDSTGRIPTLFYSATCLGTFALVWGLTHARLLILPQPQTYGPLLLLLGFLISMIEFQLLAVRQETGRITSLSYLAYALIGAGVILSVGHEYVRVLSLLMAGAVWFYQAVKLNDERHYNIAMVIFTVAFSVIALIHDFPAPFFPHLALIIVLALYAISRAVSQPAVAQLALRLIPVYMSFTFVIAVLWQWADRLNPFPYGVAFALFGLFSIFVGAKLDKLIHVHAGAAYVVAALPYLGAVDMARRTLEGNTLVFGLGMVGMLWAMASSASKNAAIRDSRSTVLWNLGALAFCLLCMRVILGDSLDMSANPLLQFQILSGPVIIAGLMFLTGWLTQSYVPVYLALFILVIIFPEIKDRFDIPMYSGLGSTVTGIGFLAAVFVMSLLAFLREARDSLDLIWRQKAFPFKAKDHFLLYAAPVMVAAFFLFTRTIFLTYPTNYFRPIMPFSIRTCLAVVLCGTAYHAFTFWWNKSAFSYIGYMAIWFGVIHSCYVDDAGTLCDPMFLPLFMLAALLYSTGLAALLSRWLAPKEQTALKYSSPHQQLELIVLAAAAVGLYALYSVYYAARFQATFAVYWAPLFFYLCARAIWKAWRKNETTLIVPAYLLFWQFIALGATKGTAFPALLAHPQFYLSTALMAFALTAGFFAAERLLPEEKYRLLTPVLWMSFALLALFSPLLTAIYYRILPAQMPHLAAQLLLWAGVGFLLGRFLNLAALWLWGIFLIYPLALPAFHGYSRIFTAFHPLTLACVAALLAGLSALFQKMPSLFAGRYPAPRAEKQAFRPEFLFSVAAQTLVYLAVAQAANAHYRHAWLAILGLFVCALPGMVSAYTLETSRHALALLPYTIAWSGLMLALPPHFPQNAWLLTLKTPHLLGVGMLLGVLTALIIERVWPREEIAFRALKHNTAAGILFLLLFAYFTTRDLNAIAWQRFVTSGVLSLGAAYYFRYGISDAFKRIVYAFFACGLTLGMLCGEMLALKALRMPVTPALLFAALLLPPFWFLAKSELNRRADRIYESGRDAAMHGLLYTLLLYLFLPLARVLFLPSYSPSFSEYFFLAPVAFVIGLALIRLHALGCPAFTAHLGALLNISAAWAIAVRQILLLLGDIPKSSLGKTFEFFTTVAVALAYVIILTTTERGLLTRAWRWLGAMDDARWRSVQRAALAFTLTGLHLLFLVSLIDLSGRRQIGATLLLLAGVWIVTGARFRSLFCYWAAFVEILAAIYSCRIAQTFWTEAWIVWLLLGFYAALIPLYSHFLKKRHDRAAAHFSLWMAILAGLVIAEHVTFYGLYSKLGILPLLLLWVITFFIPVSAALRETPGFRLFMDMLTYAPAFFFFVQQGPPSLAHLPRTMLAAVIISTLVTAYRAYEWAWFSNEQAEEPRIMHHLHWHWRQPHSPIVMTALCTMGVVVVHALTAMTDANLFSGQYVAMLLTQAALAYLWLDAGRKERAWLWTVFAEAMLTGFIFTLRQAAPLVFHTPWTVNWDIGVSLFATVAIIAARPLLRQEDAALRAPVRFTLFALPIFTVAYIFDSGVTFDTLSRLVLMYSVIFLWQAYSEKDRFVLAYAFVGINSYLLLLLTHHDIRSLQAYVTPICVSILILVQVFRDITSRETANFVRGVTLLALFGSALFEAIARNYHDPLPHFIVIGLSIAALLVSIWQHIRIFAAAGLACFLIDLIAIVYIVLSRQDTETMKVMLGVGFTLIGGLILSGYILYRKNKERIEDITAQFKDTFAAWE